MDSKGLFNLTFNNKKIILVNNSEKEPMELKDNSKKYPKQKEVTQELIEDPYEEAIKSSINYNKKISKQRKINSEILRFIDYNKIISQYDNIINNNISEIVTNVPIIIKTDSAVYYNLNNSIDVSKSNIESFIANNLNIDNWKFEKTSTGQFTGPIIVSRRKKRGTLKQLKANELLLKAK